MQISSTNRPDELPTPDNSEVPDDRADCRNPQPRDPIAHPHLNPPIRVARPNLVRPATLAASKTSL